MLLLEKVETALESFRDSERVQEWSESLVTSSAGVFVSERRVAAEDFFSEVFERFVASIPFASDKKVEKLEKKVTQLNRKLNQLKKTVDSFDE